MTSSAENVLCRGDEIQDSIRGTGPTSSCGATHGDGIVLEEVGAGAFAESHNFQKHRDIKHRQTTTRKTRRVFKIDGSRASCKVPSPVNRWQNWPLKINKSAFGRMCCWKPAIDKRDVACTWPVAHSWKASRSKSHVFPVRLWGWQLLASPARQRQPGRQNQPWPLGRMAALSPVAASIRYIPYDARPNHSGLGALWSIREGTSKQTDHDSLLAQS